MTPTLYVVPGSHPSMAGRLMLEHKGIAYRRVDLIPALHKPILRLLGFSHTTVPALRIDGRRVQNTLNVSRALEEIKPDPALFPADERQRAAVETAERWGEQLFQPIPRRLSWWALRREKSPSVLRSLGDGARLHVPLGLAARTAGPIIWTEVQINGAKDEVIRADLAALPGMLDHVEELIEEGVLGRKSRNAADYQIATSIRLLLCFKDLHDAIDNRPLAAYARDVVPDFPGHIPPVLPQEWLTGLQSNAGR